MSRMVFIVLRVCETNDSIVCVMNTRLASIVILRHSVFLFIHVLAGNDTHKRARFYINNFYILQCIYMYYTVGAREEK